MYQRQSNSRSPFVSRSSISLLIVILSLFSMAALARVAVDPKSISSEELARHIKYLASDELQGRRSGTPGGELAAGYIAAQFNEYGLKPMCGVSYFKTFELMAG